MTDNVLKLLYSNCRVLLVRTRHGTFRKCAMLLVHCWMGLIAGASGILTFDLCVSAVMTSSVCSIEASRCHPA